MVVALLGALFLVGTAFLSTVTFENDVIKATEQGKEQASVIDALSAEIRSEIRKAAVGGDRLPWNMDFLGATPPGVSNIGIDINGEVSGVHPLGSSLEPHQIGAVPNLAYRYSSDLEMTMADTAFDKGVTTNGVAISAVDLVYVDLALDQPHPTRLLFNSPIPGETTETAPTLDDLTTTVPLQVFRRDADGDGVWDSYEHLLSRTRYSSEVRGDLGVELNADPTNSSGDIYYATRVIPHGAMVNINESHFELLNQVIHPNEIGLFSVAPAPKFSPESEESSLRRRFLLPPAELPLTQMLGRYGILPETFYSSFVSVMGDFIDDPPAEEARWWPIDTGIDGQDIMDVNTNWLPLVDSASANYDYRHLITTVSYDDQLMRMGRSLADNTKDWIENINNIENPAGLPINPNPDLFFIDDWPESDEDYSGRLKVSLPGLIEAILEAQDPGGDPGGFFGVGGTYELNPIDGIADPDPTLSFIQDRFLRTIQETVLQMLKNVVNPGILLNPGDKPRIAAAYTANLVDFADTDDIPTWVEEIDTNGLQFVPPRYAYGFERQPFITEIYQLNTTKGDGSISAIESAIELYNPYSVAIDLTDYSLEDTFGGPTGLLIGTINYAFAPGTSILPNGYLVIHSGSSGLCNPPTLPAMVPAPIDTGTCWSIDGGSTIQLIRSNIPGPGGAMVKIAVDEFAAQGTIGVPAPDGTTASQSQERETTNWRWVVPSYNPAPVAAGNTLGALNSPWGGIGTIRPVHVGVVNSGDWKLAYPTTGTMLLVPIAAHRRIEDGTPTPPLTPFTFYLTDFAQPDNGRLPIFDQGKFATDPVANTGSLALRIPWGQLLFDYFTALPLSHTYDVIDPLDMIPTVDQNGMRVHGRIDINSAPATVLQGLPLVPRTSLPAPFMAKIQNGLFGGADPNPAAASTLGPQLAQGIVAYREARVIAASATGNFSSAGGDRLRNDGAGVAHSGFLTVGELANVRRTLTLGGGADIDGGILSADTDITNDDFIDAAAVLIALGDWTTVRSDVFTIYGVLRGSGTKSEVDQKAIRFQETVDRIPCFFTDELPQRIGPRIVGPYADARSN